MSVYPFQRNPGERSTRRAVDDGNCSPTSLEAMRMGWTSLQKEPVHIYWIAQWFRYLPAEPEVRSLILPLCLCHHLRCTPSSMDQFWCCGIPWNFLLCRWFAIGPKPTCTYDASTHTFSAGTKNMGPSRGGQTKSPSIF